jgi:hypothetical protein
VIALVLAVPVGFLVHYRTPVADIGEPFDVKDFSSPARIKSRILADLFTIIRGDLRSIRVRTARGPAFAFRERRACAVRSSPHT